MRVLDCLVGLEFIHKIRITLLGASFPWCISTTPPTSHHSPLFEWFTLFMYYKNFNVLLNFLVRLYYFWNNLRQISSINIYSIVINGNKNTGSCEFCVKILNRECREVPKSYGFGERLPTNCMKQISSNQKFWYYQIIFSLTTPKAILHECQRSCKFVYLCESFVYSMSDDTVYCTESAMFLSSEKQRSFGSFVNKGIKWLP